MLAINWQKPIQGVIRPHLLTGPAGDQVGQCNCADWMPLGSANNNGKPTSTIKQPRNAKPLAHTGLRLPYFKVECVLTKARIFDQRRATTRQITPWNITRVIGKGRVNHGKGVRVAVLDTGIDLKHPDLVANIKGGINIIDPTRYPQDDNGHGTHIAGVIGALNNHFGVVGIAPRVSLYAVKVLDASGSGTISNLVKGIEWAIANRMHILNISISGGKIIPPALTLAIQAATNRNMLVVAAAGNAGNAAGMGDTVEIPARIQPVISVAALTRANRRASYSATGKVDIAAPGSQILSTYSNGRYAVLSGTSMAAAHVTGVLAIYRAVYPRASASTLKNLLYGRAIDLPPQGIDSYTGRGLVQI
ncbi:S8 family peptidase [Laceyella putida]|uniref:S8 family peptidase n=1 Tax=Laceyella putida TaxID=110101 RepID=A0ABW2RJT9_9BACL